MFARIFFVKNELAFPFIYVLQYIVTPYYLDWKVSILYELFFLTSKSIYILNIVLKIWNIFFIAHISHNLLKFNDSELIMNKSWEIINIVTVSMWFLKSWAATTTDLVFFVFTKYC